MENQPNKKTDATTNNKNTNNEKGKKKKNDTGIFDTFNHQTCINIIGNLLHPDPLFDKGTDKLANIITKPDMSVMYDTLHTAVAWHNTKWHLHSEDEHWVCLKQDRQNYLIEAANLGSQLKGILFNILINLAAKFCLSEAKAFFTTLAKHHMDTNGQLHQFTMDYTCHDRALTERVRDGGLIHESAKNKIKWAKLRTDPDQCTIGQQLVALVAINNILFTTDSIMARFLVEREQMQHYGAIWESVEINHQTQRFVSTLHGIMHEKCPFGIIHATFIEAARIEEDYLVEMLPEGTLPYKKAHQWPDWDFGIKHDHVRKNIRHAADEALVAFHHYRHFLPFAHT